MDKLFSYTQKKLTNKKSVTKKIDICDLNLYQFNENIHFISNFVFNDISSQRHHITEVKYAFILNLKTGDIKGLFELISNKKICSPKINENNKNNFDIIKTIIKNGFYGDKKSFKKSVKYRNAIENFFQIILSKVKPKFKSDFFINKDYSTSGLDEHPLFELLVDFHLDMKNIKPYNSVYLTILSDYPKKKWLSLNENKFLPAILDSHQIKSNYLIGELNKIKTPISMVKLKFICNLFGENYFEYLKKIDWVPIVSIIPRQPFPSYNKFNIKLVNEHEKNSMVKLFNTFSEDKKNEHQINILSDVRLMLYDREHLKDKGINLKFNCKNFKSFTLLSKKWESIRTYYDKGYRTKYVFSQTFIEDIESDILIDNNIFKVKILKTEEDFITEGFIMQNCLSNHFISGDNYIYLVMECGKKRINLQYKNKEFTMKFGKANTIVEKLFNKPIETLIEKINRYTNLHWYSEKYDFVNKN
jgi:hypothetical protein